MNVDRIEHVVRLFGASRSSELVVEADGWRVSVRRGGPPLAPAPHGVTEPQAPGVSLPEQDETPWATIPAPLVGIFRQGDSGLRAGDRVAEGQRVGSIESMKILNPILAEVSGEVTEVLIEDGVPVEFGQQLYRLRPLADSVGEEGEPWSSDEDSAAGH